jgi:hypothetical protein
VFRYPTDALVAQMMSDASVADYQLDTDEMQELKKHVFFAPNCEQA